MRDSSATIQRLRWLTVAVGVFASAMCGCQADRETSSSAAARDEGKKTQAQMRYGWVDSQGWAGQLSEEEKARLELPLDEIRWVSLWEPGEEPTLVGDVGVSAPSTGCSPEARKAYLEARRQVGKGRLADAASVLEQGLDARRDDGALWALLAKTRFNLGEHNEALKAARAALACDPNSIPGNQVVALVLQQEQDLERAGAFLHRALQCPPATDANPVTVVLTLQLATNLGKQGYVQAAAEAFGRSYRLLREQAGYVQASEPVQALMRQMHVPLLTRANLLMKLGQIAEVAVALDEVQGLFGEQADVKGAFLLSLTQQRVPVSVRFEQVMALSRYLLATGAEPEWVLGKLYEACSQLAQQERYLDLLEEWSRRGTGIGSKPLLTARERAYGLQLADRQEEAFEILTDLARQRHPSGLVHRDLARLHESRGRWSEMVAQYGRYVEAEPEAAHDVAVELAGRQESDPAFGAAVEELVRDAEADVSCGRGFLLGFLAEQDGQNDAAERMYRACLDQAEFAPARQELVEMLLTEGQYAQVLNYVDGEADEAWDRSRLEYAARACVGMGELGRAEEYYLEVIQRDPEDIDARLALAGVLMRQGSLEGAEKLLLEVAGHWPGRRDTYARLAAVYAAWSDRAQADDPLRVGARQRAWDMWRRWTGSGQPADALPGRGDIEVVAGLLRDVAQREDAETTSLLLCEAYLLGGQRDLALAQLEPVSQRTSEIEVLAQAARLYRTMDKPAEAANVSVRLWRQDPADAGVLAKALEDLDRARECNEAVDLLLEAMDQRDIHGWQAARQVYEHAFRLFQVTRRFDDAVGVFEAWTQAALAAEPGAEVDQVRHRETTGQLWDRFVLSLAEAQRFEQARLQAHDYYLAYQPEMPASGLYLVGLQAAQLRFDESTQVAEELLAVYPEDPAVRTQYWLGRIRQGQVDATLAEARQWVEQAGDDRPRRAQAVLYLFWQGGRADEAIGWIRSQLETYPEALALWRGLVQSYVMAGRSDDGAAAAAEFAQKSQNRLEAVNLQIQADIAQGQCMVALGRLEDITGEGVREEALEDYRTELLGVCGRFEEAAGRLARRMEAGQATAQTRLAYSTYLSLLGRSEESIALLEQLLAEDPDDPLMQNNLGFSLVEAGRDPSRAGELLSASLWAEPGSGPTLDSMGWFHYKQGEFRQALGYLHQAAARIAGGDPEVWDHLGDTHYRLNEPEPARDYWQLATEALKRRVPFDRRLSERYERIQRKLEQLQAGEPVDVAGLFEPRNP